MKYGYSTTVFFLGLFVVQIAQGQDWKNDTVFPRTSDLLLKDKGEVIGRFAYDGKVTKDLGDSVEIVQTDATGKKERTGTVAKKDAIRSKAAVEYFAKLINSSPNDAFPLLQRARALEVTGKQQQAFADMSQAVKLTKGANRLINQGILQHNMKEYPKAIDLYTQALKLDRGSALCYTNRGLSYKEKGDVKEAIADYSEAIWLKPEMAKNYMLRGMLLHDSKQYQRALADYSEAIKRDANNDTAYFNRGIVKEIEKDYQSAISDFNESLNINPKRKSVYRYRASAWYHLGNLERASSDYEQALKLEPDNEVALENACVVMIRLQQYDKVGPYLKRIMQLQPDNPKHYIRLGMCCRDNQATARAVTAFDNALRLDPKSGWAYHERGMMKMDSFKWQETIDDQTKAIEHLAKYADAYASRGMAQAALKNWDAAFKDLDKALEIDNECDLAMTIKATLLAMESCPRKNVDEAINLVEKAAKLKGVKNPEVASAWAAIHAARGQWDKAQQVQNQVTSFSKSRMMNAFKDREKLYLAQKPLTLPEQSK